MNALSHGSEDLVFRGFRIPLHVRFRGVDERTGVLVGGSSGWGEFSPFPGYTAGGTRAAWKAAVSSATEAWPPGVRDRVPVHVTIPEVPPEQARGMVAASGCRAAKVKVGDRGEEARVEAVRDALGPAGRLTIDANGAWRFEEAVQRLRSFAKYGVDLVEQPVATEGEMRRLRRAVEVPIAADEIVQDPQDAKRVADTGAADVIVVKVQRMGGMAEALRAVEMSGLPAVVSSPVETSVGIAAGLAVAAALPDLPYPCGLGTAGLLRGDVVADPLLPKDGVLVVRRPEPDETALARYGCEPSFDLSALSGQVPGAIG